MSVQRIATRYAKSLIDLATEQGKMERVTQDMIALKEATKHKEFYQLLKSPVVNATKKNNVLDALFKDKSDDLTLSFLKMLVSKGRDSYLPEIADEFIEQYKAANKIVTVRLTTAQPLSDTATAAIQAKIAADLKEYNKVELKTAVDNTLIGGFVLEFDNKLYDASIQHQLDKMRQGFSKNLYIKDF
ncbi:MAG: ATP synthase F1 subunit delta [Saprospiraceae bacterium]|nr:ATP synthase F1 subunit delta [Saprospiraceae bacterium]MBP7679949.1 ATP synthase F1 subunit delta [Saprospiraceae bacterium]